MHIETGLLQTDYDVTIFDSNFVENTYSADNLV